MTALTTLFRPVGRAELDLIRASGFRTFPPRLPDQPIFYPVLEEEYAKKIARDWNTKDERSGFAGFVLRFQVRSGFLSRYKVQVAGSSQHREYWIPAARPGATQRRHRRPHRSHCRISRRPISLIIEGFFMLAFLDQIVAATRVSVAQSRQRADLRALEEQAEKHIPRGFRQALKAMSRDRIAIIAELKKASPSKGLIRENFDPAGLADELQRAGAAALSVLTDEQFFQGSLENLRKASAATQIPCLRKDFIVDEFQLVEARANCADAILLIVAALGSDELIRLSSAARNYSLDVLCEVHDAEELARALDAGCNLIGVNSRDLRTFKVDLETALRLAEKIPSNVVRVAESGIHSADDIARLRAAGYHAFLVGESLMRAASPGDALRQLLSVPSTPYPVPSER